MLERVKFPYYYCFLKYVFDFFFLQRERKRERETLM